MCGACLGRAGRTANPDPFSPPPPPHPPNAQNIMPLSAAMFLSERKNPAPQCPPRLEVQMLMPVSWSRMPNHFLQVDTRRAGERLGWAVQCQEPLMMMALHIPEENRSRPSRCAPLPPTPAALGPFPNYNPRTTQVPRRLQVLIRRLWLSISLLK